jgi:hypothetical protein
VGLTLSSAGLLSGTPTTLGTSNFTVQVTSGTQTATQPLSVTVLPLPLTITTTSLPWAYVGKPYSQTLQAIGGTWSYSWSVAGAGLPPGLGMTLSTAGVLSGTPTFAFTYSFGVIVNDGLHESRTTLTIVVNP